MTIIAEIGQISTDKYGNQFQWVLCPDCTEPRWVKIERGELVSIRCRSCANRKTGERRYGNKHPRWGKGSRTYRGYKYVYASVHSPYFPMSNKTNRGKKGNVTSCYILEHRLVMAQRLGRLLADDEIVHHINGDKLDNRIANLWLSSYKKHKTNYGTAFTEGYNIGYKKGYADATNNKLELV